MAKWETVRIGDICEVVTGGTPSTNVKEYWDNGTIPWLPSGVCQNSIIDKADSFITQEGLDNSAAKMMPIDTVVIALTGATTGKVGILKIEACANQSVTGILPNDKLYYKFLFFYLLSARSRILDDSYGGAQKHISQGYVKDFRIPLPPLETQKQIAANLDQVTHTIDLCNNILEKLDLLVKARFVEMFGTLESPVREFKKFMLKELCNKITDGKHGGCTQEKGTGRYFIGAREIYDDEIHYDTAPEINVNEFVKDYKRCNVEIGDFLIVNTGATIGKSAIATDSRTQYTLLQKSVALLKVKREILNPVFLKWCYRINTKMYMVDSASAQPNLLLSKINATEIYVPPMALQNQFAAFVEQTDKSKSAVKQVLEKAETLKKALMQEYFG